MHAVFATDTAREKLRQESVSQMYAGVREMAGADLASATAEHQRAQAGEILHPERRYAHEVRLENIKKAKTPEELSKLRAEAFEAQSRGEYAGAHAREANALIDLKVQEQYLGNKIKEQMSKSFGNIKIKDPTTGEDHEFTGSTKDILDFLTLRGKQGDSHAGMELEKYVNDIEQFILKSPGSETSKAYMDSFNKYSNKAHVYDWTSHTLGDKSETIPLPSLGGVQLRARQAYTMKALAERDLGRALTWPQFIKIVKEGAKSGYTGAPERLDDALLDVPFQGQ